MGWGFEPIPSGSTTGFLLNGNGCVYFFYGENCFEFLCPPTEGEGNIVFSVDPVGIGVTLFCGRYLMN